MLNKMLKPVCSFFILSLIALFVYAKEDVNKPKPGTVKRSSSGCTPATAFKELNINNVRCRINSGGDMHWDLVGAAQYEIPKVIPPNPSIHSNFASAIWVGGYDGLNLKLAGQTYRQMGVIDYWTGPLDTLTVDITAANCSKWDKIFVITKVEIDSFILAFSNGDIQSGKYDLNNPVNPIKTWPCHGSGYFGTGNEAAYLAPFFDNPDGITGSNGFYDPENDGDYPVLEMNCGALVSHFVPDQFMWWVINDKGDVHGTGAASIGIEIQYTAFAWQSSSSINDMTFYHSKIINRSNATIDNTYFSQWLDTDLGCFLDDYVGCDTTLGLGFCYNGDNNDANCGSNGYGTSIPIIGVDFFRGPKDEFGNPISMTKFLYYENTADPVRGNPNTAIDYYNYMSGYWMDGTRWVNDYNQCSDGSAEGWNPSCTAYTDFIFPGNPYSGTGWTEANAGRVLEDRRFLETAGPFKLLPGARNEIVTGYVWARVSDPGAIAAFPTLWNADTKAQALYDNCFAKPTSPDAPDISIVEMDRKLILTWTGSKTGNNYFDNYKERIASLEVKGDTDPYYHLEGYLIYQLLDDGVSASDLKDNEKAKLIAQCDVKNGVNFYQEEISVPGVQNPVTTTWTTADAGIYHSIEVTSDVFALGNNLLVNNRPYYFMVVAYGYNDGVCEVCVPVDTVLKGVERFIYSETNIGCDSKGCAGIPHKVEPENGGTTTSSNWGDRMTVTRIQGTGNWGNALQISSSTEDMIVKSPYSLTNLPYPGSTAPINLKVVNPKKVIGADYRLEVSPVDTGTGKYDEWKLYDVTNGKNLLFTAGDLIKQTSSGPEYDQQAFKGLDYILSDRGVSIALNNVGNPGDISIRNIGNGFISASVSYADPTKAWLTGIADSDGNSVFNWIHAGSDSGYNNDESDIATGAAYLDSTQVYEKVLNGTWVPYRFSALGRYSTSLILGPRPYRNPNDTLQTSYENTNFGRLPNVDIVLTADKSKWSKCVVVYALPITFGGDVFGGIRSQAGHDINEDKTTDGASLPNGMGWFPGYAIDLDRGVRLNLFYGENSVGGFNGSDMYWNPDTNVTATAPDASGLHYVYVHYSKYDECASIYPKLAQPVSSANLDSVYKDVMWVGVPLVVPSATWKSDNDNRFIPPTTTRISFRVNKSYNIYAGGNPVYEFSTKGLAAELNQNEVAKNALDLIRIVPNPYYAYAAYYETGPLDSRVKITNLPQKATIKIFTLSGTLVKTVDKDDNLTYVFWNLQNTKNIPVASGVYIIHIDAPGIGEKIIKFFGVMRPLDIDSY